MLLILSDELDYTTSKVIEWLIIYGIEFKRSNWEEHNSSVKVSLSSKKGIDIKIWGFEDKDYNFMDFSAFWYRRGEWEIYKPEVKKHKRQVSKIFDKEWHSLRDFFHFVMENKPSLGSIRMYNTHNKLIALAVAMEVGLKIPDTLVTTDKNELEKFIDNNSSITKAIWNMFRIFGRSTYAQAKTEKVTTENIQKLWDIFFPTLIQHEIKKAFELRIFFMNNALFPMAIFSQLDEQTKVDFRNYNREKPNRNVPYVLPEDIHNKLITLMKILGLNTGSIDMIVTPENEFVFLEVNPVGQFGWVSLDCNYYIEEKIAQYFKALIQ